MSTTPIDMQAAREQLAQSGWITRQTESFRHLSPPPAALWLGEQSTQAPTSGGDGWTLQPTKEQPHVRVGVQRLGTADAAERQQLFAGLPLPDAASRDDAAPFAWAHRALCHHGLRLQLERTDAGADVEAGDPVWLDLQYRAQDAVEAPLAVIEVGAGVQAVLVETHPVGSGADTLVQNLQLHVPLGAGASLVHLRVIEPRDQDQVAHHVHVKLAQGARYRQALIGEGSRYHLQRLLLDLEAEDASACAGTVLMNADTALDLQARVRHLAPRTHSQVQALALARDTARVVLNAHTYIAPGCDDADVHQRLSGVPLHGQPRLVLRPHMEILHDQVQATHGATWGALPEDALFYAQQRGIASNLARGLIVHGMANDLVNKAIGDDALAQALDAPRRMSRAIRRLLDDSADAPKGTPAPAESGHG